MTMKKQSMPYEATELGQNPERVDERVAVSSDIEPGTGGGELGGTRSLSYDDYE